MRERHYTSAFQEALWEKVKSFSRFPGRCIVGSGHITGQKCLNFRR